MRKCVFFDRDGIVNRSPGPGYVENWAGFEFMSGFVDALRCVRDAGYEAIVVSNQRGIALGVMSREDVEDIHCRMRDELKSGWNLDLLDVFYCPHRDEDACDCRKPKAGMLIAAARKHDIELGASWMIGDHERDIEAGRRAGCRTILVLEGSEPTKAHYRVSSMQALQSLIAKVL